MKIFSYLKPYWYAVVAILALLVVQAHSDLSLPNLTSNIVDVGIMQGGVESPTPDKIRKSSMDELTLFMKEDEKKQVLNNYKLEKDVYVLHLQKGMTKNKLSNDLTLPMVMVMEMNKKESTKKQLTDLMAAPKKLDDATKKMNDGLKKINQEEEKVANQMGGTLPAQVQAQFDVQKSKIEDGKKQLQKQSEQLDKAHQKLIDAREKAKKKMGDLSKDSLKQVGITFTRDEMKALHVDTKKIQTDYMIKVGLQMIGLTFLSAIASIIVTLIASYVAASVSRKLRVAQYERTLQFSNAEMDKFSAASLITRNTNDIQQIQMGLVMALRLVLYAPILGIGGIYNVVKTGTGMGWIVGVAVGSVAVVVLVLLGTTMPKFKALQTLVDRVNLVSREILSGLNVIRAFSREEYEEKRFDVANTNLMKTQLYVNRAMSLMMPLMMLLMNAISVLIVWVGGHNMDKGSLQVGDMMAFITYTMMIVMSFMMLSMVSIILPRANVAAIRVSEVIDTEPSITNKETTKDGEKEFTGEVKFEGVLFHFPDAKEDVLHHINFTAKPGKTTALIGSTGSGKSTIVNLIPRLYDVTGGRITIDGVDIRDLSLHKLHELIGFVPQKGVLFSGDIASNIQFGDAEISEEQMQKAAEIAQATEFINQSEEGFSRSISQGGSNVSGGQKQRLSIARAIAKQPKVLIFDDSFSALDNKTDVALRRAISENIKDVTTIIVAQKISTILHADNIIVLDEGRIVAQGKHEELMETSKVYQEIAQSQLSNSELGIEEAE